MLYLTTSYGIVFAAEEKERVHCLGQKYDMECKRRLDLLESAVQAGQLYM